MTRIVFLDIDDVLLTARAHALPANAARIERMAAGGSYGLDLLEALPVTFDPCAVAWLNRLVQMAEARIVVHSSWRVQFTAAEIRAHLLAQGVSDVLKPTCAARARPCATRPRTSRPVGVLRR